MQHTTDRKVLVTGATGFIGRALVPALRARGLPVVAATRRSTGPTIDAAGVEWRSCDLLRQGFRQHRTQGDPVQQSGVFVIAKGGGLLSQYVSREAGDHPDNADLLRALDEEAASRSRT